MPRRHGAFWADAALALQWLLFSALNIGLAPAVVGPYLGLSGQEVGLLVRRMFFLSGTLSILQLRFGHRLPIVEGPAGIWWVFCIQFSLIGRALGASYEQIRYALQGSAVVAAFGTLSTALLGSRPGRVFTRLVNGVILTLLGVQTAKSLLPQMVAVAVGDPVDSRALVTSLAVVVATVAGSIYGGRRLQANSVLAGIVTGWLVWALLGSGERVRPDALLPAGGRVAFLSVSRLAVDGGSGLAALVIGLVVAAHLVASIDAMRDAGVDGADQGTVRRAILVTGIGNVVAAVTGSMANIPYSSSAGLVQLTGEASRRPFLWHAVGLIAASVVPASGTLVASIPGPVAASVLFVSFALAVSLGIKGLLQLAFDKVEGMALGLSLMAGAGVAALPDAFWIEVPQVLRLTLSNGVLVGAVVALVLEQGLRARLATRGGTPVGVDTAAEAPAGAHHGSLPPLADSRVHRIGRGK